MFVVGGIAQGRLHGFYIANGKKEFITVQEMDCARIGESKIRAKQACSFKWISDHPQ